MGHVFISYSHQDGAYVDRLIAYLAGAGIEAWTDRGIEPALSRPPSSIGACATAPPSYR